MNDAAAWTQPGDVRRGVLVAVPFYRNEALVGTLAASLRCCADDFAAIGAELVFYDDSPDYPPLALALAHEAAGMGSIACRVETNPANLGFVRTMNRAVDEAVGRGLHLVMLNSDTQVCPGALPAMLAVLRLDRMHGFVNPRSDNATIATLPLHGRLGGRQGTDAVADYEAFAQRLPPFSYVPTVVGFCLLVRWEILAEFGGFDEVYGQGYNEENDLVMRASRVGYRAVLANHAFVLHQGEASFSLSERPRTEWERRNRAILDKRYPEYAAHTRRYYDTPEFIAERLLACLVPGADGRLDVALDCSSFYPSHNGTFQAGRQLIAAAAREWRERWRVHVLCSQAVFDFHDYASLGVQRADPHGERCFAAIFRVGQPYDWNVLQRVCTTGAVLGVYMLDTISLDCPTLASPLLQNLWQFTMDQVDVLATQSRQTERSVRLRLRVPPGMISVTAPHSLDVSDYLPGANAAAGEAPSRLLVVGNHYAHKHVVPTANALAAALPGRHVLALGARAPRLQDAGAQDEHAAGCALASLPNLEAVPLGDVPPEELASLYASAAAVIFPSFAEGFGFPTLNAVAAQRPLFARRLPATEEIWTALGCNPNVRFYDSTEELAALLQTVPDWDNQAPPHPAAPQSADGIGAALQAAMRAADYTRIVARIQATQFASDTSKFGEHRVDYAVPAVAANLVARRVERWVRLAFERPTLFRVTRYGVRVARYVRRKAFFF